MRDIPVFTTECGVGTLVLQEIPYSKTAYVKIQDASHPEAFIEECKDFCRMAGAEKVYAAGHVALETYPLHAVIVQMRRDLYDLQKTEATLVPVSEHTLRDWCQIYNEKMASVPNAAYMTAVKGKQMLERADGYFIYSGDRLLGIGMAAVDRIDAVASIVAGAGADIVLSLCQMLPGSQVTLDVAEENIKAVRLYERLGFVKTVELSRWYKIFCS